MTLIHYSHDPDDFHDFPHPFHFLFKRKRKNGGCGFEPPYGDWLFDRVAQPSRAVGTVGELSSRRMNTEFTSLCKSEMHRNVL